MSCRACWGGAYVTGIAHRTAAARRTVKGETVWPAYNTCCACTGVHRTGRPSNVDAVVWMQLMLVVVCRSAAAVQPEHLQNSKQPTRHQCSNGTCTAVTPTPLIGVEFLTSCLCHRHDSSSGCAGMTLGVLECVVLTAVRCVCCCACRSLPTAPSGSVLVVTRGRSRRRARVMTRTSEA